MSAHRFEPPPYPHDRLGPIIEEARRVHGEPIDLSIGTPCDTPPMSALAKLDDPQLAKGYPPAGGHPSLRKAVVEWFRDRLAVDLDQRQVGVCVGTKELVAGIPHWLRLRDPERDTVLYPQVSYPTYAMGALLAGCRPVPVPLSADGSLDLASVSDQDAERALCIWSNSPSNPTGKLDDLAAVAQWGRDRGVPVFSDECYLEFTWVDRHGRRRESGGHNRGRGVAGGSDGARTGHVDRTPGETILSSGTDGVVAVNSLSKRSNMAGLRVGFFAGDSELVEYLAEIRKHSGLMIPGPVQAVAVEVLGDQAHVEDQRGRYIERLEFLVDALASYGLDARLPDGGFYLWIDSGDEGGWSLTERLARDLGVIVSPGDFYGPTVSQFIRVAAVQPLEVLQRVADLIH